MGSTEIALFGSLSSIGALIGTPPIGIFLDIIGRKYSAMAAGLMSVVSVIFYHMILNARYKIVVRFKDLQCHRNCCEIDN